MKIERTDIEELYIFTPDAFVDERGFFMETYRKDKFQEFGIDAEFVQDTHSRSAKNVLRGLHKFCINAKFLKLVFSIRFHKKPSLIHKGIRSKNIELFYIRTFNLHSLKMRLNIWIL